MPDHRVERHPLALLRLRVDNVGRHLTFGGLPPVVEQGADRVLAQTVLSGVYHTVFDRPGKKLLLTLDRLGLGTQNGIETANVIDWLLDC